MIFARNQGWIGMDLGASRIKVAQVLKTSGRLRLAASSIESRHQPVIGGSAGRADAESGGRLAATIARQHDGLSGSQVACVLPIGGTDLRTLTIPAASDGERRSLIVQELLELFDDYDDRVYDYWVGSTAPKGGDGAVLQDVSVVSASKATVTRLTDDLAGREPDGNVGVIGKQTVCVGDVLAGFRVIAIEPGGIVVEPAEGR